MYDYVTYSEYDLSGHRQPSLRKKILQKCDVAFCSPALYDNLKSSPPQCQILRYDMCILQSAITRIGIGIMRRAATPSILVWLTTLHLHDTASAYQPVYGMRSKCSAIHASDKDDYSYAYAPQPTDDRTRRALLQTCGGIASSTLWNNPVQALDQSITDCLLDLPPKPPGVVRLYLCRHGQTENNRLLIVQGSRVDPPLNTNGVLMAERLGAALYRNQQQPLTRIYHSPLLRAQQTGQIAASQFSQHAPKTQLLSELSEIDFGPAAEGQKEPRPHALEMYEQWSMGHIDERPPAGESCRDVLERCSSALSAMVMPFRNGGKNTGRGGGGHIAAVTHSAYLRMLLALAQGTVPLAIAVATQRQANANINVLDIDITATVMRDAQSGLFGGSLLSQAPDDFSLVIPRTTIMRVNEVRHLEGLQIV